MSSHNTIDWISIVLGLADRGLSNLCRKNSSLLGLSGGKGKILAGHLVLNDAYYDDLGFCVK